MKILGEPARLVSKGKNKDIYSIDAQRLGFIFTSRVSAFDGVVGATTEKRGHLLCECSAQIFTLFEYLGIPTQLIRWGGNQMIVRKLSRLPFEFIVRNVLMGSAIKRLNRGELELPQGMTAREYEPFPHPFFEITTKLEDRDRIVSQIEMLSIAKEHLPDYKESIIQSAMQKAKETTEQIGQILKHVFAASGFVFIDGKLEYGLDERGHLYVIDSFGPDEFRACTPDSLARARLGLQAAPDFYDKEFLRRRLQNTPKDSLQKVIDQYAVELEQRYEEITSALGKIIERIINSPKARDILRGR